MITGVGLASPNGDSLAEFRKNLLGGVSGVERWAIRHVGETLAGVCHFDALRYQKTKEVRRGTRAGSSPSGARARRCSTRASPARLDASPRPLRARGTGVYIGITEHGNVETENEIHEIAQYGYDLSSGRTTTTRAPSRTIPPARSRSTSASPGPPTCIGAACAAGNLGLDPRRADAAAGRGRPRDRRRRVREHPHLRHLRRASAPGRARRPRGPDEGLAALRPRPQRHRRRRRRLPVRARAARDARARGAQHHGEVVGYAINSRRHRLRAAASPSGQNAVHARRARARAASTPDEIDLVARHATSTPSATSRNARPSARYSATPARRTSTTPRASSATPWARPARWSWPATCLRSTTASSTRRSTSTNLDPACEVATSSSNEPRRSAGVDTILNMSFGMLGINSAVVVGRFAV